MNVKSPLKWHGGKHYLARKIVSILPPHTTFCEPFAGSLAVLLARDPSNCNEIANDWEFDLTNFWKVLQGGDSFASFHRLCEATPFSEVEWSEADLEFSEWPEYDENVSCRITRAWRFFVHCRQSMAGRMKSFAPISKARTRRGMNEQASAWLSAVEGLPAVHARLKRVTILNRDALDVIRMMDGDGVVQYLDPPYVHSTRTAKSVYRKEMTEIDHLELLEVIVASKSKFALSGYQCPLYDAKLADWNRHDFEIGNHSASGATKRRMIESVWCNF